MSEPCGKQEFGSFDCAHERQFTHNDRVDSRARNQYAWEEIAALLSR